jgi:hypothetical protein
VSDDLTNLGLETHIKHSICLVEHEIVALPQGDRLHLEEVIQATRGSDDDVHT